MVDSKAFINKMTQKMSDEKDITVKKNIKKYFAVYLYKDAMPIFIPKSFTIEDSLRLIGLTLDSVDNYIELSNNKHTAIVEYMMLLK